MNNLVDVKIKLFDKSLPLPEYQTKGSAGIDLYARVEVTIPPHEVGYIPLNVALQLPKNYWALLSARSSLHKKGLMLANGIGVGDYDYRGPNDEYLGAVLNFTDNPVTVQKAERIIQLIVMNRELVKLSLIDEFSDNNRGGFGSTGS